MPSAPIPPPRTRKDPIEEYIKSERLKSDKVEENPGTPKLDLCGICNKGDGNRTARWVECGKCNIWFHISCAKVSIKQYDVIGKESTEWICLKCKKTGKMDRSKFTWGEMDSKEAITGMINRVYAEIITWDKNLMRLPRGKAGKDFIIELTRLFTMFTPDSVWEKVSLSLVQIFIPLLLQKPSARSKARENNKYLISRLQKWDVGDIEGLLSECRMIQSRLQKINVTKDFDEKKAFCRRMLQGKVKEATRLIDNEKRTGILPINDDTIKQLREKHPPATKRDGPEKHPTIDIEPVLFEEIDGEAIKAAAKNTHGSGGPTLIDADGWKHILCSKSYGKCNDTLAQAIADVTKRLCTETIAPTMLSDLLASKLIPLDKRPGVRPIGIGEVLRRIITKTVTRTIKEHIKAQWQIVRFPEI